MNINVINPFMGDKFYKTQDLTGTEKYPITRDSSPGEMAETGVFYNAHGVEHFAPFGEFKLCW